MYSRPNYRNQEPCRLAVILDSVSGLRVGELLGLKWEDVEFERFEINVTRSVSRQVVTPCKTEVSRKPIPITSELADLLREWKLKTPYSKPADWIFASPHKNGSQPFWPGSLFRAHIEPALKKASISAKVGWHTLRHSFGTLMKANGEDLKTIQELLRHATFKVTADTYTQAVTPVEAPRPSKGRRPDTGKRLQTQGGCHFLAYWSLSVPREKGPKPISLLESWRPRRDLNPCYRRERAMS